MGKIIIEVDEDINLKIRTKNLEEGLIFVKIFEKIHTSIENFLNSETSRNIIEDNVSNERGREQEIYPYIIANLVKNLNIEKVKAIGTIKKKFKEGSKEIDIYLEYEWGNEKTYRIGVELKGPSIDTTYIENYQEDWKKLISLIKNKELDIGFSFGIWVDKNNRNTEIKVLGGNDEI